jgi:hypothetical protein
MANPSALTDTPAVLKATTTEGSVTLDPLRQYTVQHLGVDDSGVNSVDIVALATSADTDADFSEGADKVILLPEEKAPVGPGKATLKFKAKAGTIMLNVLVDPTVRRDEF